MNMYCRPLQSVVKWRSPCWLFTLHRNAGIYVLCCLDLQTRPGTHHFIMIELHPSSIVSGEHGESPLPTRPVYLRGLFASISSYTSNLRTKVRAELSMIDSVTGTTNNKTSVLIAMSNEKHCVPCLVWTLALIHKRQNKWNISFGMGDY